MTPAPADTEEVEAGVDRRLSPWMAQLGTDHEAYRHHVLRVLAVCDRLHEGLSATGAGRPSRRPEYLTAAAFHDLGIWTAGTLDYLGPSVELARGYLANAGRGDLEPVVTAMIEQHHKIRRAGDPSAPVEVFRRADLVDVTQGLRRFGVPLGQYRAMVRRYPYAGFHRRLISFGWKHLQANPTSPLPMVRW
jgi:hypothetical protein